ncbi:MAG: arginine deiminase-related protein, partial [Steroidobacteraceae bacterium]
GEYLEGTGSLVLDRCHRIAYACWSPRTTRAVLADFAMRFGYRVVSFDAEGPGGQAIYHTNVLMAIGERFSVVCPDAIPDPQQRATVLQTLEQSGHAPITISIAQMNGFAGNLLALKSGEGEPLIAMSAAGWDCLAPPERRALERFGRIVTAAIPTIERHGGGSVRCMIAEVFLPR